MTGSCDKFIKKAKEVHGDRYDYINTKYLSSKTKVEIICNEHGSFIQSPAKHISGRGCPECAKIKRWDTRGRMNFDYFILSAKKIHQNKYEYEKTDIDGNSTLINITCPTHGVFSQRAYSHISGSGCPSCADNQKKDTLKFIDDARKIHKDKYNYEKTEYVSSFIKIDIECQVHGIFQQTPDNHINGRQGCPFCGSSGSYNLTYFEKNKEEKTKNAKLYVVSFTSENENFIKVGITKKNTSKRFPKAKRNGYNISTIIEKETTLYNAWGIEQMILSKFKSSKYTPLLPFPGHTEALSSLILIDVIMTIEESL